MSDIEPYYKVMKKDLAKNNALKYGAWLAPAVVAVVPALLFFILFLFSSATPTAAMFFFLSLISLGVGFVIGLIISGVLLYYRSRWVAGLRERIAVDGIRADEIEWFMHELTTAERKALKEIEARDMLLGDAYRETLASRLTASRIIKAAKHELLLVQRRQNKLKYLKSEKSEEFIKELERDRENLENIRREAESMRVEAETRLQMIDAAVRRGTSFADTELALKKLTARSEQLPLALEAVRMEEEIRRELEKEELPKLEP
jgi:hypothetical protein